MPSLSVVRAANSAFSPSYLPVAVIVGGTSGIGRGIAERFAHYSKGNAHIIIVGRNEASAKALFSQFPKATDANAKYEFVSCDARYMKNVRLASREILQRVSKINFLFMSQGYMTTAGREETEEGIDKKLAVHYYSRWAFIDELLPALKKAKEQGEDAKVLSVLAAGHEGPINFDDLGLKTTFSTRNAAYQAPAYNNLMVEEYASRNPGMTFMHAYPGGVRTQILSSSPSFILRGANHLLGWMAYPITVSESECGDYMLHGLLNHADGAWRINNKGDDIGKWDLSTEEGRKKLWDHSAEATKVNL